MEEYSCEILKLDESTKTATDGFYSIKRNKNYKMDHPKRGRAIIFNHVKFTAREKERNGSTADVENLTKALLKLGFEPEDTCIHENLTAADIFDVLKKFQEEDHSDRDLLMVFVLTHGGPNHKLCASDVEYSYDALFEFFKADRCKTLAGKPKIFFINACRGYFKDPGFLLPLNENVTETDARPFEFYTAYTIPVSSDFLYVFSTNEGHVSYRHKKYGTWYIQAFCKEISETDISQLSFTDFLTNVNGRLSTDFELGNYPQLEKQVSTFSSSLTKRLCFTNKFK